MSTALTVSPALSSTPLLVSAPAPGMVEILTASRLLAGVSLGSVKPKSAVANVYAASSSAGIAVERAGDIDLSTAGDRAGQNREVLQCVRTGVRVTGVVRRDSVVVNIDALARIAEDRVAQHLILRARIAVQHHASPVVRDY